MDIEESTPIGSTTDGNRHVGTHVMETPLGLKRLASSNDMVEFSGFHNKSRGTMRRIDSVEREVRLMREILDGMMTKYDLLANENKETKSKILKYDHIMETNKDMKEELGNIRKENKDLKKKCENYEAQLEDLKGKVMDDSEKKLIKCVATQSWMN